MNITSLQIIYNTASILCEEGVWNKNNINNICDALYLLACDQNTGADNNPLATTYNFGADDTDYNSVGVKNYINPEDGVYATIATFKLPIYSQLNITFNSPAVSVENLCLAIMRSKWGCGNLLALVGGSYWKDRPSNWGFYEIFSTPPTTVEPAPTDPPTPVIRPLAAPIVSAALGIGGYWLCGADGGVFACGSVGFYGSLPSQKIIPAKPIVAILASETGKGYYLIGADGGVFCFGDAIFHGSLPGEGI
jgi:hypothetical protein